MNKILEENKKKYPLSNVEFTYDLRDSNYTISSLISSSRKEKEYPDIIKKYDYPILNQHQYPMCVGYTGAEIGSYTFNVQPDINEMFSPGWIYGYRPDGYIQSLKGMNVRDAFKTLTKVGLIKEKDFPYKGDLQFLKKKIDEIGLEYLLEKASKYKMENYINLYNENDVKEFLNNEKSSLPSIVVLVYENFYDSLNNKGIIPFEGVGKRIGSHDMTILGVKNHKYVLLNHWGNVGDNGIFYIDTNSPTIVNIMAPVKEREIRKPITKKYTIGWNKEVIDDKTKWFYSKDGISIIKNDWIKLNNKWYYLGQDGYAYDNQWIYWKNIWYFLLKDSCEMATNQWIYWKNIWYYCNDDGSMAVNQWIDWKSKKYYVNSCGEMVTGIQNINKIFYEFDNNGALIKTF